MYKYFLAILFSSNIYALDVYKTDNEFIPTIPVTNNERIPYVLYSIGPIDLFEGNILDVRVQAVLSNECTGNIGIGRYVNLTKERYSIAGQRIIKTAMSNTTINDHHAVLVHSGIEKIKRTTKNNYINFVVFAQSTQCEGKTLKVEGYDNDGFGELIILIH